MFNLKKCFKPLSKFELLTRLIFYGLLLIISFSFLLFLIFLYQRFYVTLSQAEEIVILKSQLAIDELDVDLYHQVKTAADSRSTAPLVNWSEISNPFK